MATITVCDKCGSQYVQIATVVLKNDRLKGGLLENYFNLGELCRDCLHEAEAVLRQWRGEIK